MGDARRRLDKSRYRVCCGLPCSKLACADKRIALVNGNSVYTALPAIPNPKNEALKIGEALKGLGYQATTAVDEDKKTMKEVIERFSASAGDADVASSISAVTAIR